MARAPVVDIVVGPQSLSPPAGAGRARATRDGRRRRSTPTFPAEDKFARLPERPQAHGRASRPSSPCRKAATSSAPSASCPTRAAPSSRGRPPTIDRRGARAGRPAARARSRCSARTSTPITARRRRPRLVARELLRAPGEDRRASSASATPPATRATWTMR